MGVDASDGASMTPGQGSQSSLSEASFAGKYLQRIRRGGTKRERERRIEKDRERERTRENDKREGERRRREGRECECIPTTSIGSIQINIAAHRSSRFK